MPHLASNGGRSERETDARVARTVPGARLVEIDSDHYLTLRQPEQVKDLLREFLSDAAPA